MSRLINQQTEIGLLLAAPGLLATMVFSSWIIQILYTSEFLPAVESLRWFSLGCLGRVISWPLGFVMLAMGKSAWLFGSELTMNIIHIVLIVIGLEALGLNGVAVAFFLLYLTHILVVYLITNRLIGFRWDSGLKKIGFGYASVFITFIVANYSLDVSHCLIGGFLMLLVLSVSSLKIISLRLDKSMRVYKLIRHIPFLGN